jgi:hypothetical protein
MGRFTLDLPAGLGPDAAGTAGNVSSRVQGDEAARAGTDVDRATAAFLAWFDCWAA